MMQNKIWYIQVEGQKEGPYSIQDLKIHPRMTPDTLVWKAGFKDWLPARKVPELKVLFEDEEPDTELKDRFKIKPVSPNDSILALEGSNFPYLFFWIIILLIVLAYVLYKL